MIKVEVRPEQREAVHEEQILSGKRLIERTKQRLTDERVSDLAAHKQLKEMEMRSAERLIEDVRRKLAAEDGDNGVQGQGDVSEWRSIFDGPKKEKEVVGV